MPLPAESELKLILLLKVFQSDKERAPVVVLLAILSESCCHRRLSPLSAPRVNGLWASPERMVMLPERDVIFIEFMAILDAFAAILPESKFTSDQMRRTNEFMSDRFPERVVRREFVFESNPENEEISKVKPESELYTCEIVPERAFCARASV